MLSHMENYNQEEYIYNMYLQTQEIEKYLDVLNVLCKLE